MAIAKLPVVCPSCSASLLVSQMACPDCSTSVSGNYPLPVFLRLTQDERHFILQFLLSGGSLKEMAVQMGNSYPTVRNKLDDLISKVKNITNDINQ